jgi:hypothetical protein
LHRLIEDVPSLERRRPCCHHLKHPQVLPLPRDPIRVNPVPSASCCNHECCEQEA